MENERNNKRDAEAVETKTIYTIHAYEKKPNETKRKENGSNNETQVIKLMFIYTITPNAHINTNRSANNVHTTQFSITQLLMSCHCRRHFHRRCLHRRRLCCCIFAWSDMASSSSSHLLAAPCANVHFVFVFFLLSIVNGKKSYEANEFSLARMIHWCATANCKCAFFVNQIVIRYRTLPFVAHICHFQKKAWSFVIIIIISCIFCFFRLSMHEAISLCEGRKIKGQ